MHFIFVFIVSASVGALLLLLRARVVNVPVVDSPEPVFYDAIPTLADVTPAFILPETLPVHSATYPSDSAIDTLKQMEGFSSIPYADPPGQNKLFSIGYGYQIRATEKISHVTESEAFALMAKVINEIIHVIKTSVTVPLSQPQYDALILFIYNIGQTRFRTSTLLKELNDGNYLGAADQLPRWIYANKKVNQALVARRKEERALFLS